MKNIIILIILAYIGCIVNASNSVDIFNDGYASDIQVYSRDADSAVVAATEDSSICKPGWLSCVKSTTLTENGFYGFKTTEGSFSSDECRYIEFSFKVIPSEESTSLPKIQCSIETVPTPKRITLNSTNYVNTGGEDDYINILDWSFVRIKLSDLNVNTPSFNSFQIWADQKGTTIIFGEASFWDSPTSLYPIGSFSSTSTIKYSFYLLIFTVIISILL